MKNHLPTLILPLIFFSLFSCSNYKNKIDNKTNFNSNEIKKQDSLAFKLCEIYGSDQGIRHMKLITNKDAGALKFSPYLDSINFFKIVDFVKDNGIPNEKLVGKENFSTECVRAAYMSVLLHTPHMLINNEEYLDLFVAEVENGNLKVENLITILDKYYVIRKDKLGNRKLLYGSQFGKPCLKFRKKSDSVRATVGLPPLKLEDFKKCK